MGQKRPRRPARWAATSAFARTRLGVALAALALAIQCFVVETHVDGLALRSAVEVAQTSLASADAAPKGAPATCLICQEAAISRSAVLAGAPAVHLVEHTLFLAAAPPRLPVRAVRPTLPWQSRAPPTFA